MGSDDIKILTYNVRGLKEKSKRLAIFGWLRKKKCDMILLQETHCHLKKRGIFMGEGMGRTKYLEEGK